ncbi:MAG TPA: hypothetical protein VF173_24315, partial [Thermoanaerobaculia bacterium]|nr:hypothetical protein [Thermoanaerobaculia bacterium]
MSTLNERDIRDMARKLAESESFEPPAGLLDKIKAEIPPEVAVGTAIPGSMKRSVLPRQRWLIAASLVATVGAGLLGLRTWQARERASLETQSFRQKGAPQVAPEKTLQLRGQSGAWLVPPPPPPPPPKLSKDMAEAPAAEQVQPAPPAAPAPAAKPQREELRSLGYL